MKCPACGAMINKGKFKRHLHEHFWEALNIIEQCEMDIEDLQKIAKEYGIKLKE